MKKVVLPPELNEEFPCLKFIPYGDMMVRIQYAMISRALSEYPVYLSNPVDEIHKAAARLMEYNYPNLIAPAFPWRCNTNESKVEGTLVFIDPDLFKPQTEEHHFVPSHGPIG
jgi:hypothetical protein